MYLFLLPRDRDRESLSLGCESLGIDQAGSVCSSMALVEGDVAVANSVRKLSRAH